MSVAYYIVLDKEELGFETFVSGKALAHEDRFQDTCQSAGLKTFDDYLTVSAEDIGDMLGEEIELPEGQGEEWFPADEGIIYFSSLTEYIQGNPASVDDPEGCLEDLADYIEVLKKAKAIGAKWHLNMDI